MKDGKRKNGKLFLLICIITFVSVVVLKLSETALIVETTKAKLKEEGTHQYTELANSYAKNLGTQLDMYYGHMDMYVKADVMQEADGDVIMAWLEEHVPLRDEDFDYIAYISQDGKLYTDLGKVNDIADRDYYDEIINKGTDFFIDDPVTSKTTGQTIIHVCRPVRDGNGKVTGGIAAIVNVDDLKELLEDIDLGEEGAAILYSGKGEPMGSNVSEERAKELEADETMTAEFQKQMEIQGDQGAFFAKHRGESMLVIYEPVEYTPWRIVMMITAAQVYEKTAGSIGWLMSGCGVLLVIMLLLVLGIIIFKTLKPLTIVEKTILGIATGDADLTKRIDIHSNNEIGRVVEGFNQFSEKLQQIIATMKDSKNELVDVGELLQNSTDDTASAITQIIANIQSMGSQVNQQGESVTQTAGAVNEIASNIESLNRMIESQSSAVTQASAAVEEMIGNINSVNNSVQKMAVSFEELEKKAVTGVQNQNDVNNRIEEIQAESQALQEANTVISGIAEQTNLLAMNAAIEAAHAGEAGKGFSVVADEIRKLSEDSSSQSQTIGNQLAKIIGTIDAIVNASVTATESFNDVANGIHNTTNLVREISNAMTEQNEGSKQIAVALNSMNDSSNEVKTASIEMAEGNKTILEEIKYLQDASFNIKNGMEEMSAGARKINETGAALSDLSAQMQKSIDAIGAQVDQFKV